MSSTENSSPAAANAPPDDKTPTLKERWDHLDEREKAHEDEGTVLEDERWAIAKDLHDQWNPHNLPDEELPLRGSNRPPRDGKTQGQIARETGRSQPVISQWVKTYRHHQLMQYGMRPRWIEAFHAANPSHSGGGTAANRTAQQYRKNAAAALREQPEEIAPEIAKAMEDPKVAKAVQAAMSNKAKQAVAAMFAAPKEDEAEEEQDEPTLAAVPDSKPKRAKDPYAKKGDQALRNKIQRGDETDYSDVVDLYTRDAQKAAQAASDTITALEERMKVLVPQATPVANNRGRLLKDPIVEAMQPILALKAQVAVPATMAQKLVDLMADDGKSDDGGKVVAMHRGVAS